MVDVDLLDVITVLEDGTVEVDTARALKIAHSRGLISDHVAYDAAVNAMLDEIRRLRPESNSFRLVGPKLRQTPTGSSGATGVTDPDIVIE